MSAIVNTSPTYMHTYIFEGSILLANVAAYTVDQEIFALENFCVGKFLRFKFFRVLFLLPGNVAKIFMGV